MPKTGQVLGSKELNSQEFRRTGVRGSSEVPEVAPPLLRNATALGVVAIKDHRKAPVLRGKSREIHHIFVDISW